MALLPIGVGTPAPLPVAPAGGSVRRVPVALDRWSRVSRA
jgi:hypothetical protein